MLAFFNFPTEKKAFVHAYEIGARASTEHTQHKTSATIRNEQRPNFFFLTLNIIRFQWPYFYAWSFGFTNIQFYWNKTLLEIHSWEQRNSSIRNKSKPTMRETVKKESFSQQMCGSKSLNDITHKQKSWSHTIELFLITLQTCVFSISFWTVFFCCISIRFFFLLLHLCLFVNFSGGLFLIKCWNRTEVKMKLNLA